MDSGEAAEGQMKWTPEVVAAVMLAATCMFIVNLIVAAREVEQVRQETPDRVR